MKLISENVQSFEEFVNENTGYPAFDPKNTTVTSNPASIDLKIGSRIISKDGSSGIIISKNIINGNLFYVDQNSNVYTMDPTGEIMKLQSDFDKIKQDKVTAPEEIISSNIKETEGMGAADSVVQPPMTPGSSTSSASNVNRPGHFDVTDFS